MELLSLSRIKQLKSLHKKKIRRIENKFILEGHRLIDQALSSNNKIEEIWVTKKSKNSIIGKKLVNKIYTQNIPLNITSNKIIQQISDSLNNQGIIALASIPNYKKFKQMPMKSIYLDGISDPGNMGTILRTAAWFGIKSIFLSDDCVDPFNSKVVRSAMGAHFYFQNFETISNKNLFNDLIKSDIVILGANIEGDSINTLNISNLNGWCLVLGSESHGIKNSTQHFINYMISIPNLSNMESLNVSVAGGILLYTLTSLKPVTN